MSFNFTKNPYFNFLFLSCLISAQALTAISALAYGWSGQTVTIDASTNPQYLNLSGTRGDDGDHGHDALDCTDGSGNNGASGENGEDGQMGGDGGDIYVYTSDLALLKNIQIVSLGAPGGNGGFGGRGGRGCDCFRRVQHCFETADHRNICEYSHEYCTPGNDGPRGRDGSTGIHGSDGTLNVIVNQQRLLPQQTSYEVNLGKTSQYQFVLSRHVWNSLPGAANLLAPGSRLAYYYNQYERTVRKSVKIKWQAEIDAAQFAGYSFYFDLTQQEQVGVRADSRAIFNYQVNQVSEDEIEVLISNAFRLSDLHNLKLVHLAGNGVNMSALIRDDYFSQAPAAQFIISLREPKLFSRDVRLYEQMVPAELVHKVNHFYILELGKLPNAKKLLERDKKIVGSIQVLRTFLNRPVNTTLGIDTRIK